MTLQSMTLQIRDARARAMAETLARARNITMTEAVIQALEAALRREAEREPLADRLARIAADLSAQAGPAGRAMGEDEVDAMWGHP